MMHDECSLVTNDLDVDLNNLRSEDEKLKSESNISEVKLIVFKECSNITEPEIKNIMWQTNIDACSKILPHVINASSSEKKK